MVWIGAEWLYGAVARSLEKIHLSGGHIGEAVEVTVYEPTKSYTVRHDELEPWIASESKSAGIRSLKNRVGRIINGG